MFALGTFLFAAAATAASLPRQNSQDIAVSEVVGQCKQNQYVACCTDSNKCESIDIGATNESDFWSEHCQNFAACCSVETNLHNVIVTDGGAVGSECNILQF